MLSRQPFKRMLYEIACDFLREAKMKAFFWFLTF